MLTSVWTGTNPNLLQLTQVELIKRVLYETGMGVTGTTTATGTSTTLVDATNLKNTANNSSSLYVGGWVRITSGARIGEISPISSYAPSTGTITFTALTGAPGTGVTYEIWMTNFPPQAGIDALTRLLTEMYYVPCWTWLTEVPDGDMEQDNTTEYAGTSATIAKVTTQPGTTGKRSLSVTNTAANGYAQTAESLRVKPGSSLLCSVNYTPSATTGITGVFTIYDVTNSAVIDTVTTTSASTVRLYKQVFVPPTCRLVKIRMGAEEDAVVTRWDELSVLDNESPSVPVPWWVKRPGQVKAFYEWRAYQSGYDQYEYEHSFRGEQSHRHEIRPDHSNASGLRAVAKFGGTTYPLFIFGARNETAFPDLTTAKPLDENWVTAGLAYQFLLMHTSRVGAFMQNNKEQKDRMAMFLTAWNAARAQQTKECRAPESGRQALIEV